MHWSLIFHVLARKAATSPSPDEVSPGRVVGFSEGRSPQAFRGSRRQSSGGSVCISYSIRLIVYIYIHVHAWHTCTVTCVFPPSPTGSYDMVQEQLLSALPADSIAAIAVPKAKAPPSRGGNPVMSQEHRKNLDGKWPTNLSGSLSWWNLSSSLITYSCY